MEKWKGRVALVTGASSGIGADIARCLATEGMNVVGCARNIKPIEALASEVSASGGHIEAVTCDVRKEEEIFAMFKLVEDKYGGVDVCVNNAGLSHQASLLDGDTEKWREMMDVNILAPCVCSRETIKSLHKRGKDDGHIINMNSVAGHRASPTAPQFYSASKHALKTLTEGLKTELQNINSSIRVTYLEPVDVANAVVYALSTPPHVKIHDIVLEPTLRTKNQESKPDSDKQN